jgi:molybdopterin-containing oxidoreductase family iron-sulfur binding subunit
MSTRASPFADGRHAGNPWLQELPDPVMQGRRVGNYAAIAPRCGKRAALSDGDVDRDHRGSTARLELPALIQPGSRRSRSPIALGYGRTAAGHVWTNVGANAYPLVRMTGGMRQYAGQAGHA